MSVDVTKLLMSSLTSSGKLVLEGSGATTVPASLAGSESAVEILIPHGQDGDNLIWQVGVRPSAGTDIYFTPFSSQAQTVKYVSYLDSTDLHFEAIQGGATDRSAFDITYYYRVYIP